MQDAQQRRVLTFHFPTTRSLEEIAQALAEGDHDLGETATAAGYALIAWPGTDCPWFIPGPSAGDLNVAEFAIVEAVVTPLHHALVVRLKNANRFSEKPSRRLARLCRRYLVGDATKVECNELARACKALMGLEVSTSECLDTADSDRI